MEMFGLVLASVLAVSPAPTDGWATQRERQADGSESVILSTQSGPTFDHFGKKEGATLALRGRGRDLQVFVVAPLTVGPDVRIGFDDEEPTRYPSNRSADFKVVFVGSPTELLKRLLRHHSLRVQFVDTPFGAIPALPTQEVIFSLAGLSKVVQPLIAAAGLASDFADQPLRPGKWLLYGEKMETPALELASEKTVRIGTTDEKATLALVCRNKTLDAYIKTAASIGKAEVWTTLDSGKSRKTSMAWGRGYSASVGPTAGLSVFFPDPYGLLSNLLRASTLTVALGRSEGPFVTFDVAHLAEHIGPLRQPCRIK